MSQGTLTREQERFYRDAGYYRLRNCFTKDETAEFRAFVSSEAAVTMDIDEAHNPNKKLYGLYDRDPRLMQRVIGNQALVGVLQSLLGPNIVYVTNRHNHATINSRKGEPAEGMHRDVLQPTRSLLTAVLYLQPASVGNGATRIIPTSHDFPYVGAPQADGGGTWLAEHDEYDGLEDQALPVPMDEGDVLLFNATLFHGIGSNASGMARASMTLGFRSVDELDAHPDSERLILVSGKHIYRGNDR